MKNRRFKTWMTGLVVLLLISAFQAEAQRGGGYGPGNGNGYGRGNGNGYGPGHMDRLEGLLDLSEEQAAAVERLHLDFQKESLSVRNKIQEKNAQLNTLITEGADRSKIDKLVEEIGGLRTSIQKARIGTHLKVRELLNDDQKVKFDNHFINRSGFPEHRGGFGPHGRGWN